MTSQNGRVAPNIALVRADGTSASTMQPATNHTHRNTIVCTVVRAS
jgi:hypothetical protein